MSDTFVVNSRPTLGFTFEGLSGRDETLFKALVRLLDHRTQQRWVYRPGSPDLRVVGEATDAPLASANADVLGPHIDAPPPLLLSISATARGAHCLGLPLRADALEAELNSLGVQRVQACGLAQTVAARPGGAVQLLRWPPAHLLGSPERVRLATLMVSKPVTLAWVQQRAGLPPAVCAQFFGELQDAGMLTGATAAAQDSAPGVSPPHVAPIASTVAAPVLTTGLLARIRSRLGLLVRTSLA